MKKFLSMALAMLLICTSMGVVATGEEVETDPNLMFYSGFEGEGGFANVEKYTPVNPNVQFINANGYFTLVANAEEDKAMFGERCMRIASSRANGDDQFKFGNIPLEAGEVYKLSFWFKYTGASDAFSPKLICNTGGNFFGLWNGGNGDVAVPKAAKDTWSFYEMYLPVPTTAADPKLAVQFRTPFVASADEKFFYDEIRFEKVDGGVSLNFAKGSNFAMSKLAEYSSLDNANGLERAVPATVYLDKEANTTTTFYPFAVKSVASNAATGSVRVFSQYIPKNTAETATLIVGVYKDVNGTPQLQNIFVKPCVYNETIETGIDYLDVDMTSYEGCYIEAFMLDGANMLKPMGDSEVLPAVTPAV